MRWILDGLAPNYHTIADFLKKIPRLSKTALNSIQTSFRMQALSVPKPWPLMAVSQGIQQQKNNYSHSKIDRHLSYIEQKTEEYLLQLDQVFIAVKLAIIYRNHWTIDLHFRQVNPSYAKRMSKIRSRIVEPALGTLINFLNMRKINSRGMEQANKHVLMAALTYNLKKYLNFERGSVIRAAATMKIDLSNLKNTIFRSFWPIFGLYPKPRNV